MIRRSITLGAVATLLAIWAGCAPPTPKQQSTMANLLFCDQGMPQLKEIVSTTLMGHTPGSKKEARSVCDVLSGNPDWTCYQCVPNDPLPPADESIAGSTKLTVTGTYGGVAVEATMDVSYSLDVQITTTTANTTPKDGAEGTQRSLNYVAKSIYAEGEKTQRIHGAAAVTAVGGVQKWTVDVDTSCSLRYRDNFYVAGAISGTTCGSTSTSSSGCDGTGASSLSCSQVEAPDGGSGSGAGTGSGSGSGSGTSSGSSG